MSSYDTALLTIPFITANVLISYKLNVARKAQAQRELEDKAFTKYEKSLDDYVGLVKRLKEKKTY